MRFGRIGPALIAALCLGSPASAQSLSAQEFLALGAERLESGDLGNAAAIINALLARNPNDVGALMLGAQLATAANDAATAARLAKKAYWRTRTSNDSFVAARIAASAHASLEQDSLAQLWLRRARQYSPNDTASEGIARDYVFLRNRNPWSTSLSFGISPTSNVNGGGYGETSIVGFAGAVQAEAPLPGIQINGSVSTSYRVDATKTYATFFDLFANVRTYHLLPKANDLDPDARGSDYASGSIGIGLRHRQVFAAGSLPTDFSLRYAQNWSGGVVDTRTLDFGLGHKWALSDTSTLGVNASAQDLIAKDDDPATSYGLTMTWTQAIGADRLSLSIAGKRSHSDDISRGYTSRRIFGNYAFGEAVQGLNFDVGFDYDVRNYDNVSAFLIGSEREEQTTSLTLRVRNENIEFYGFQPVATLNATNVESTIDQYDRDFLSLGFDLRSSF